MSSTYYATYYEDSDGNLISDGRWTNSWNGENRLIKMETRSDLVSSVPDLVLEFEYDSQGRRFKNTVISNSVSTVTYFLYDGWNLIAEFDSNLNPIRTYTWGSDLSGSLQGAGGVGGLLAISDSSSSDVFYASYDGNGNLTALVDSSDGSVAAVYEYDAFGQILRMTGDYAEQNPFRFSTKFQDESGWVYYGYRYLIPGLGRWASRDPIGEEGGLGLYGFVGNGPMLGIDPFGLAQASWKDLLDRAKTNADIAEAIRDAIEKGRAAGLKPSAALNAFFGVGQLTDKMVSVLVAFPDIPFCLQMIQAATEGNKSCCIDNATACALEIGLNAGSGVTAVTLEPLFIQHICN